jgi:UDP-glucose 4-epimerase
MGRVVLVTGVCRDLGGRFARLIASDPGVDRVIGVDVVPPRSDLGGVRFVRADIRNPVIAKVIAAEDVDTVVHLSVIATPSGAGGRTSMKEINVIGTMQLLAACQKAPGVERLIVKSSSRVYGSSPRDPAMFSEEMAPKRLPRSGFGKDSVEVEGYVRGFARRRPDVTVTMLRCASLLGPKIETNLTRYFELPLIPTVAGFDGRLQFCHEDDALAALHHATMSGVHGTFNVAGDGVLMVSQAVRRLGRPSVALPAFAMGALRSAFPQARRADLNSEHATFLSHGRALDTTAMREILGFEPTYTTPQTFDTFAQRLRPGPINAQRIAEIEESVAALIERAVPHGRR